MQYNEIKDIYSFSAIHFNLLKIFLVICTILSPTSLYIARSGTIPQLSDHDPPINNHFFSQVLFTCSHQLTIFLLKNAKKQETAYVTEKVLKDYYLSTTIKVSYANIQKGTFTPNSKGTLFQETGILNFSSISVRQHLRVSSIIILLLIIINGSYVSQD